MATLSFEPAQERVSRLLHELHLVRDEQSRVIVETEPRPASINEPEREPEPELWVEPERLWVVRPKRYQTLAERVSWQRAVIHESHDVPTPTSASLKKSKTDASGWQIEGLYVPLKPFMSEENISIVTGRICRERGRDTSFYEEIEPDPLQPLRLRTIKDEKKNAICALPIKIVRPVRISERSNWLSLKLDINRIVFHMHDLFTQEDALSAELENLMQQYQQRAVVDLQKYYSDRIRFLRQIAMKESEIITTGNDETALAGHRKRLVSILENIVLLTKSRDLEQGETRFLFARIYDVWQNLKQWRSQYASMLLSPAKGSLPDRAYFGTKLRLYVKEIHHDYDLDQREWDNDLEQSIQDAAVLHALQSQTAGAASVPQFDYDQIRTSIRKQMRLNRRPPGQPDYEPILDRSCPITADEGCSVWEISRRKRIRSSHIHLKLFVNGKKVCHISPQPIAFPGFSVQFNNSVELKVLDVPEDVVLKIYRDDHLFGSTLLSKIFVGIPTPYAASMTTEYAFANPSRIVIPEKDECSLWPPSSEPRAVQGDVILSVSWDENIAPTYSKTTSSHYHRVKTERIANSQWVKELDPNDPRNLDVLELHRRIAVQQSSQFFESWQLMPELSLLDLTDRPKSARRQVLLNRNKHHLFDGVVPLIEDDIPEQLFEEEGHILNAETEASMVASVSEVVRESGLPEMNVSSNIFESCCVPSRKLRPDREHRIETGHPSACSVIIQVIRAQNVPIRRDVSRKSRSSVTTSDYWKADRDGVDISDFNERVESVVEVSFQQETKATEPVLGPHPTWNESLILPLHPPNGSFSPPSILSMRDEVTLNLFDLVKTQERASDSRLTNTTIHRVERRWLGSVSLPLTTIYLNRTIEGHLRLQIPLNNLGYECVEKTLPTILYIFATLDPLLALPQELSIRSEWTKKARLYRYASEWLSNVKALPQCKERLIKTLVQDITGNVAFIPHFVTPLPAPLSLTEEEYIRFVSRIPFLQDIHLGDSSSRDIWCSASEFLELLAGDWEEHAILLANYFLVSETMYQSGVFVWHTYVIMGMAIPEGQTCMVMRNKSLHGIVKETQLINAVTGDKYSSSDAFCPLVSVGCVFNHRNIWANIQQESLPSKISYQLDNPSMWRPFFTRTFPESNASVSIYRNPPAYLIYPDTYYLQRAQSVEKIIERQFISWRSLPTYFDHGVSQILRDTLQSLEFVAQGRSALPDNKDIDKIRSLFTGMHGFPISFPDAGDDCVVENSMNNPVVRALHEMKFHDCDNQNMTFARAVYIYPYPNGVGSLWMYFAALATIP